MSELDDYGRVLLAPIVYEPVFDEHGARVGWRVPDEERERWDAPRAPAPAHPVDTETRSLEALQDALEPYFPSPSLIVRLAVSYELDPARVSRLTTWVLEQADVHSPCGLLFKRLGELRLGDT